MSTVAVGAAAAPAAAATPASTRWLALDALRGFTIAAMILVNNPGDRDHVYAPLEHADWHGCTFTDLVFPTFLFVAGVAIVPAFARRLQAGAAPRTFVPRILRRVAVLCLLGLLLSAFPLLTFAAGAPSFAPLLQVRLPGVLQRIGVCYGVAALLYVFTKPRTWLLVLLGCLLLYWPLVTLVPVPGIGPPDLAGPQTTLQGWLDRAVFGEHIWGRTTYDPEGILSTIPAIATILFGVFAGRVLASGRSGPEQVRELLLRGALLTAAGAVWGWSFPINKSLWTSSYAVFTAGIATSALGCCLWFFDLRGHRALARPLVVYGVNALLAFVGSGLLGRVVGRLVTVTDGGETIALKGWLCRHLFASWADPAFASLLYALLWVLGWYAVLAWLWRRGIVWKA